jgi:hypothetical protein
MNIVWFFAIAGGALVLGLALALGMFKQDRRRQVVAMAGAFVVAAIAVTFGYAVSSSPTTAPSNPPDPQGTHYDTPARPSDDNALPNNTAGPQTEQPSLAPNASPGGNAPVDATPHPQSGTGGPSPTTSPSGSTNRP